MPEYLRRRLPRTSPSRACCAVRVRSGSVGVAKLVCCTVPAFGVGPCLFSALTSIGSQVPKRSCSILSGAPVRIVLTCSTPCASHDTAPPQCSFVAPSVSVPSSSLFTRPLLALRLGLRSRPSASSLPSGASPRTHRPSSGPSPSSASDPGSDLGCARGADPSPRNAPPCRLPLRRCFLLLPATVRNLSTVRRLSKFII